MGDEQMITCDLLQFHGQDTSCGKESMYGARTDPSPCDRWSARKSTTRAPPSMSCSIPAALEAQGGGGADRILSLGAHFSAEEIRCSSSAVFMHGLERKRRPASLG